MGDSFPTLCKDYSKDGKLIRAGCGLQITMKKLEDGKWKPFNADGSLHKHAEPPKDTKKVVQLPVTDRETFIREVVDRRLKELGLV